MKTVMSSSVRKSRLVDGRVVPPSHFEVIAVDHCNLACPSCNHASPFVSPWFADPETVYRDLSVLAKYYRPGMVKIIGGEPLLHDRLNLVVQAVRATGLCECISLSTNATLLHLANDAIWEAIDEIQISVYPGAAANLVDNIFLAKEKALHMGKKITLFRYDTFRKTFALQGSNDQTLVDKVYAACKIANYWGCHAVRDGYFYKCPQSIYLPDLTKGKVAVERLAIVDRDDFATTLLDFVNAPVPLSSCAHCTGTVGVMEEISKIPRGQLARHIDLALEDIIDYPWLERSLVTHDNFDDCNIVLHFKMPRLLLGIPWLQKMLREKLPAPIKSKFIRVGRRPVRTLLSDNRP